MFARTSEWRLDSAWHAHKFYIVVGEYFLNCMENSLCCCNNVALVLLS